MELPAADRLRRTLLVAALAALLIAGPTGCVQRRLTIRTNPPGALVYVDNYEIGTTPVSVPFTYYGKRQIRIVKDGYETQTFLQPIPAPWYQCFPLDFFSENVIPWEIRDNRTVDRQLTPQLVVPTEELLARAQQLRGTSQASAQTAPSNLLPPSVQGVPPLGGTTLEAVPPTVSPLPPGASGGQIQQLPPQQLLPAQP